MRNRHARLLGYGLLAGGMLVAIVMIWLATIYAGDGTTSPATAYSIAAGGVVLITGPQIGLGLYILRNSRNGEE